ncbi:YicC/YloC family endoribonuclease [Marasmitruncus massiliensis]|uniref:YicC/YloC family endoribonuclease n=1 Tax=Marasmitruncus massiliensis TaxID=1944642 RepID=UPI000C7D01D0|nr:YicC/YloC family endoribonuclease [Marasmitruncus massiliensis]MBE6907639.1 YicC family protein [Oscillospiraceae bacterium]
MIRSMTGYGRAQRQIDGRDITVEIKSVNHRFFEFSARVPRMYGYVEEKLKSYIQGLISRGKVEVGVTLQSFDAGNVSVEINRELAGAYVRSLRDLGHEFHLQDDLTLSSVSRFTDIFTVSKEPEDEEAIWSAIKTVADEAVAKFVNMRTVEGERLKADLLARLAFIESRVAVVVEQSPRTVEAYRERLAAKIAEVLADRQIDEARIITEAAIFADRIAVDEETVRLSSHIAQFRDILTHDEPVGRKLDFLVQEINREVNTIGSKAQDVSIAQIVVDMKSEVEKIREQIQNIE